MATKVITNTAMGGDVYSFAVEISSASILNIFSSPVELVPTPGPGKILQLRSIVYQLEYNSVPYATDLDFCVRADTSTGYQSFTNNLLGQTQDIIFVNTISTDGIAIENKSLVATTITADPTAGNSPIKIYGTYKIITLI